MIKAKSQELNIELSQIEEEKSIIEGINNTSIIVDKQSIPGHKSIELGTGNENCITGGKEKTYLN
ncbi:hypothetical protein [Clostridium grantii]|uniref:Uncharacterized protein n=1 Tax=Clostridium grantii DSM 8605 TaxID=1121316 RepID=A0A1M5XXR3_9CLOT|nr:hypothetical protein [Clostridium grantii]SHI04526.1 hypothetical protein SAMN02745207_04013 [Clostridium grantii DSM 8605]